MEPTPDGRRWPAESLQAVVFIALAIGGLALRIAVNNVQVYSTADESEYLRITEALRGDFFGNYSKVVDWYQRTEWAWLFPPPSRFGYFALSTLTCNIAGACDLRVLAWLETLAGALVPLVVHRIARDWFDKGTALVAMALCALSPLQLAMGRRALQDELVCLLVCLCVLWFVRALRSDRGHFAPHLVCALCGCVTFSVKETLPLLAGAFAFLWWQAFPERRWQWRDLVFLTPPFFYLAGNSLLAGGLGKVMTVIRLENTSFSTPYPIQYQSGPPHRYLLDFFTLSPLVFLLAASLLGRLPQPRRSTMVSALGFLGCALAGYATFSQNVRFFVAGDALLCVLGAHALVLYFAQKPRLIVAAVGIIWACNWLLFQRIFLVRAVYDPTTFDLLRALDAVPR